MSLIIKSKSFINHLKIVNNSFSKPALNTNFRSSNILAELSLFLIFSWFSSVHYPFILMFEFKKNLENTKEIRFLIGRAYDLFNNLLIEGKVFICKSLS